jgi:predicted lipid-binding transport protein (Tim44 family)
MNRLLTLTLAALAVGTLVAADFADARRMSGGRSLGAQRSAPAQQAQPQTPPSAAPAQAAPSGAAANPVMPRQGTAQSPAGASAAKAAPGAAAAAPKSGLARWMGPLAGLAAGLGLAALASYLGIADELLSALLIAGLVVVAIVAIRAILARRAPARNAIQYAGAAAGGTGVPRGYETSPPPAFEPLPAATAATAKANVPAGFDVERFLLEAKHQFAHLQAAPT